MLNFARKKIKSPDFNVTIDNEANYQPTYWYTVTNKDVPKVKVTKNVSEGNDCLLYTSPSPRDRG